MARKKTKEYIDLEEISEKVETFNINHIKFKNKNQEKIHNTIKNNIITFITGPAGSGKTFMSCYSALWHIKNFSEQYDKIILIKSVTSAEGEEIGWLKGDINDKLDPYMSSYYINFERIIGKDWTKKLRENKTIDFVPIAFIRGLSFMNSIIIIDEAQNVSMQNMRSILTRIGENCKIIILGDTKQVDLRVKDKSSLERLINEFKENNLENTDYVHLKKEDIVRHPIIAKIEEIFEKLYL